MAKSCLGSFSAILVWRQFHGMVPDFAFEVIDFPLMEFQDRFNDSRLIFGSQAGKKRQSEKPLADVFGNATIPYFSSVAATHLRQVECQVMEYTQDSLRRPIPCPCGFRFRPW